MEKFIQHRKQLEKNLREILYKIENLDKVNLLNKNSYEFYIKLDLLYLKIFIEYITNEEENES